jgi:hypothetical protein
MCLEIRSPAIDEEAYGNKASARYHQGNAELRAPNVVIALLEFAIDAIVDWSADLCPKEEADGKGDVIKTTDANTLAVSILPDGREC